MSEKSRRTFLKVAGVAAGLPGAAASLDAGAAEEIPALLPRDGTGRQFVYYADCCSGVAGASNEKNHIAVNQMVQRIKPRPEFIAFPGDAVVGYITDYQALRKQWDYWTNVEMGWLKGTGIPLYQSTSNHNTYDLGSEKVFCEVHPHLPQNGAGDQKGLAYYVRNGNLLYVSTHQPDRTRPYRKYMLIDTAWLDEVLKKNADARFKLVVGHYPVFPVNGYTQYPLWCFRPKERQPFWNVLVKHGVTAYLASHILAFDVQVHAGIPQILSGGAGTMGSGPLAMMPLRSEYLHAVQMALDSKGLRCQVRDVAGKVRESLSWPFALPATDKWHTLEPASGGATLAAQKITGAIGAWRFQGQTNKAMPGAAPQTLICGWDNMEGVATVWIGFDDYPRRLVVRLVPQSGYGRQTWTGPAIKDKSTFDFQVALHSGMGPGGVLFRQEESAAWESLASTSSKGAEDLTWPRNWVLGHGQSGPSEWPFVGKDLRVTWTRQDVPAVV